MKHFVLSHTNAEDVIASTLLSEMRHLKHAPVFRTVVALGPVAFTILTTSERVHLNIGRLTRNALGEFCGLLHRLLQDEREMLFEFEYKTDKPNERPYLITCSDRTSHGATFHISLGGGQPQSPST